MGRSRNSLANIATGVAGQGIQVGAQLVVRTVMAQSLGLEYIGLNAYLLSVIGVLGLAELGAGVAFAYVLYKPLAMDDRPTIAALVAWFRRFYRFVALALVGLVCLAGPLVVLGVENTLSSRTVLIALGLFTADSAAAYLMAHLRTLLIADQRERDITTVGMCVTVVRVAIQVLVLHVTEDYLLFLGVQCLSSVVAAIIVGVRARIRYPYLNTLKGSRLDAVAKEELSVRLRATFLHRLGAAFANSSESIILGVSSGLTLVGGLANYRLLLAAVDKVLGAMQSALGASVGNLIVERSGERTFRVFRALVFANTWMSFILYVGFVTLSSDFVELWLGPSFLLDRNFIAWMAIGFLTKAVRRPVNMFKTAFGLFVQDRFRPLAEAGVGLAASLLLLWWVGPIGVLIGPVVGFVLVNAWVEPMILFRHGFKRSVRSYFIVLGCIFGGSILAGWFARWIMSCLMIEPLLLRFIVGVVVVLLVSVLLPFVLVSRRGEFKDVVAALRWKRDRSG